MLAAPFRRPPLYFRLYLSFSEFRHGFVGKGVPPAVGDYDVVQQGQFPGPCLGKSVSAAVEALVKQHPCVHVTYVEPEGSEYYT